MADEKIRVIIEGVDKASGTLNGIGKAVLGIGAAAAGVAAGALVGLGAGLVALAKAGEPIAGVQAAFEGFTASVGVGSETMLSALQVAAGGLITNTDLMKSFNNAAQLVSIDFAQTLPDAMQYLGRVAAATGQDMGFLLQSLVTGVGRLSPMILDNLGIQVDLTKAYEDYAASIGKTVDELTKQEQQTALTNQVLEKLAINTANLPDPSGGFAAFNVTLQNLRDTIAVEVLPMMTPFINALGEVVNMAGQQLVGALEALRTPLQFLGQAFADLISGDIAGFFSNLRVAVFGLFQELGASPETLQAVRDFFDTLPGKIQVFIDTITELKDRFLEFITPLVENIAKFVEWKDVLIALGLAVAAVVVPAILSIVAAAAQVALVIGGLVAIVAAVRTAWETDWLGIRTAAENVASWFVSTGLPNIQGAIGSMQAAAATFSDRWQGEFSPNIQAAVNAFIPLFETVKGRVKGAIDIMAITAGTFADRWQDTWMPNITGAVDIIWQTIQTAAANISGAIASIAAVVSTFVGRWNSEWKPNIIGAVNAIKAAFETAAGNITGALGAIGGAIDTLITKILALIDTLADIVIPDILTPGSPTPFEIGLRGIISAVRELNPELERMAVSMAAPAAGMAGVAAGEAAASGMTAGFEGGMLGAGATFAEALFNGMQAAGVQFGVGGGGFGTFSQMVNMAAAIAPGGFTASTPVNLPPGGGGYGGGNTGGGSYSSGRQPNVPYDPADPASYARMGGRVYVLNLTSGRSSENIAQDFRLMQSIEGPT